eukprot:jgi/Undpi1/1119/HiC_scaffold_10.g04581.m1
MARVVNDGAVGACGIALAAVGFLGSERWGQHGRRRAMGAARTSADGSSAVWDNAKAAERVRFAAAGVVLCSAASGAHAFNVAFLAGRGHVLRRSSRGVDDSRVVAFPVRGQGAVEMSAEGGPAWRWGQATASALAALQIVSTGAPAMASVLQTQAQTHSVPSLATALADAGGGEGGSAAASTAKVPTVAPTGTFQEVWSLSDQFYFDRAHKGNDWEAVKSRLSSEIASGKKSENAATKEMLKLLKDKYTRLIGPEVYDMLSKYDLIGVGVMLSPNPLGQLVVASPPKADSQADKLGVKKGDLILSINGLDAVKMDSFEVTDYLAKYQGKTVTFEIRGPEDGSDTRKVELDRTFPATENAVLYGIKDQGKHKIGYARLRDFNSVVAKNLREALVEMKGQGADEFVLDLRGNGGGAFQSALGVAGLFMDAQPITYVVDGSGQRAEFMTKKDAVVADEPLVVWVDGHSASSSEVLAGALQDDCRAVLRGERTFGKGLVQAVYGLADGQGLILTVAQYETPRGTYIHGKGIEPDIRGGLPLKMFSTSLDFDEGQFDAARQKMKACPPMESSRLDFKGAAGTSSASP